LKHPSLTVFTHANAAQLCGAEGHIEWVHALNYRQQEFRFEADTFIVAAGVIESIRLLLSSPDIPDPHDQMGRYFHDHVSLHAGQVPNEARRKIFQCLGPFVSGGVLHTCKLEASTEAEQMLRAGAVMAHFAIEEPADGGMAAVRQILTALQRRSRIDRAMVKALLRGTGEVLNLAWTAKVRKRRFVSKRARVWLNIDMEQPARAESRVRLSSDLDALGLRKARVDWTVGDEEQQAAARFYRLIAQELAAAGFGPVEWSQELLEGQPVKLVDTYHAMGGLRMGTDLCRSVVDRNLKVHGMKNIYVASCAVYPSGGSSNPTFTLMALSLRLGDHLLASQSGSGVQ